MHKFRDSISAICVAAAWADGAISEMEKQALDRVHVQLGFSRPEIMKRISQAVENGPSQDSVEVPTDEEAQTEFMRLALAVCLADAEMNEYKVNFLSKLAKFLSVSSAKLDEIKRAAEELLNPQDSKPKELPTERVKTLLPEQMIQLDLGGSQEPKQDAVNHNEASSTRKPLSELLYRGDDYGGELSLS